MQRALSVRQGFLDPTHGPVTAVAASRASPDERSRALPRLQAAQLARTIPVGERVPWQDLVPAARSLDPVERAVAAIESGALLLVPGWSWARQQTSPAATPERTAPCSGPAAQRSFALTILDSTGLALAGLALRVTTPDGDEQVLHTDGAGRVVLEDLDPGSCTVTSEIEGARIEAAWAPSAARAAGPPGSAGRGQAHLVEVTRHHVRTGDTPERIAEQHQISWDRIADFNWGTADPEALERRFADTLGCTRRTPDGRLRFDDRDDPGVLLVPRPWEARLAVGSAHELRVGPLRPLFLSARNEAGLALPGAAYRIRFSDGSERQGRLGARGLARLDGVPDLPFTITYPDELELLAASFAVSVRRALDEPAVAPLFTLLMQSREVIDRAAALYHQHLDDLTGRGLAADIDETITDPEARQPLEALLSLAPLPGAGR